MTKVPFSSLYTINRVKFKRIVIGLPGNTLSEKIGYSSNYVYVVENTGNKSQYSHQGLLKIATVFKCDVFDLYPPDELLKKYDGSRVEKDILSLSRPEDMRLVVDGLIAAGYFNVGKTLIVIAKHLMIHGRKEMPVLEAVLAELVNLGAVRFEADLYFA